MLDYSIHLCNTEKSILIDFVLDQWVLIIEADADLKG